MASLFEAPPFVTLIKRTEASYIRCQLNESWFVLMHEYTGNKRFAAVSRCCKARRTSCKSTPSQSPLDARRNSALFWAVLERIRLNFPFDRFNYLCVRVWTGFGFYSLRSLKRRVRANIKNSKESNYDGKRYHVRSYYPVRIPSAWCDHHFNGGRSLGPVDRERQQSVARIAREGAADALADGPGDPNPCHSPHTAGGAR